VTCAPEVPDIMLWLKWQHQRISNRAVLQKRLAPRKNWSGSKLIESAPSCMVSLLDGMTVWDGTLHAFEVTPRQRLAPHGAKPLRIASIQAWAPVLA
jgi:hypothetical protein